MSYENLPQNLKEKEIFGACRLEDTKERGSSKVPYNLVTGNKAKVNVPSDFTSFDKAVEKLSTYDGLAIRIDEDMIAIDLDHCVKNGEISDWAMEILEHFPNAYIEYSPSGTVIHILFITTKICHCLLQTKRKKRRGLSGWRHKQVLYSNRKCLSARRAGNGR